MNRWMTLIAGPVMLTLQAACNHPPSAARLEGASSFTIIEPPAPAPPSAKPGTGTEIVQPTEILAPAEPIQPLTNPVYPRAALGVVKTPVLVGVQISVDSFGRVTRIGSSRRVISTPGRLSADFVAAIEEAVGEWRFTPAEKRWLKPMKGVAGKEDFWLVTRVEKTDYEFDIAFTFTVSGEVTGGLAR